MWENLKKIVNFPLNSRWALQMILKLEKEYKNVTVLAITTVDGITDVLNATKNTYRILDGLGRTDVSSFWAIFSHEFIQFFFYSNVCWITRFRFQFTKELPKPSFRLTQKILTFMVGMVLGIWIFGNQAIPRMWNQ